MYRVARGVCTICGHVASGRQWGVDKVTKYVSVLYEMTQNQPLCQGEAAGTKSMWKVACS